MPSFLLMKRLLILLPLLWGLFPGLNAQLYQPYAQPNQWETVSTDHFDVYFVRGNDATARISARLAEQARYDLAVLYDIRPEQRYSLILFDDAVQLLSSNQMLQPAEADPGLFQLPTQRRPIFHPGSTEGLYQQIKAQVSHFLLDELSSGDRLGSAVQNDLLLHDSPWFHQGLNEYVGEGWTFEDEMWVHSLPKELILPLTLEGEGDINRRLRKSVWHFIAHEYGDQKLSEIVYLVNISNSVESGIVSVLGITLRTLTSRWRDYLQTRSNTQRQRRVNLEEWNEVNQIALPSGYALNSFAYQPATGQIAAWLHKRGAFRLFIYQPDAREWQGTSARMGVSTPLTDMIDLPALPLAWSPDGNELVTVLRTPRDYHLAYLDVAAGELERRDLDRDIRSIFDLSWSHDGASILGSALRFGQIDLFSIRVGSAELKPITNDGFDDREPSWSLDDQRIFFASNRDTAWLGDDRPTWELRESTFDLYGLTRGSDAALERLTLTPFTNERKPMATTSFLVKYLTDESGIWNLNAINVFLRDRQPISNVDLGLGNWSGNEAEVLLSAPFEGEMRLYQVATASLTAPATPELTLLRLEYIAEFQTRERQKARQRAREQAAQAPVVVDTPAVPETPTPPTEPDTAEAEPPKEEASDEPVRYYIFDEEDEPYDITRPQPERETAEPSSPTRPFRWSTPALNRRHSAPPDLAEIDVRDGGKASGKWSAESVRLGLSYDPLAGVGLDLGLTMSDVLQKHRLEARFQPYVNNSFGTLRYSYRPGRIDWYGEGYFQRRLYRGQQNVLSDSLLFRYNQTRVSAGLVYPFSAYTALDLRVGWHNLQRIDQQVRRTELFDASDNLIHLGARLNHNQVQYHEHYRYGGWEANLGWDSYLSVNTQAFAFHRLEAEVKHYLPVYKRIVLATRLGGAFTLPNDLTQLYLGGVNNQLLVFGLENNPENAVSVTNIDTSLNAFQYQDFRTTVRGFRPISRDGSRYLVANWELRIPLSRLMRYQLNSGALYKLELIPFVDVGAVWSEGNPFNQKKPTDTRIITSGNLTIRLQTLKSPFLVGFGSGLRMNLLGYSLRTDLAWGVDDQQLTKPMIMMSVGKNF